MSTNLNRLPALAALLAAGAFCACGPASRRPQSSADQGRSYDWANVSLTSLIEKYGYPDRIEPKRVVWENKGPWKRIAVWDEMDYFGRSGGSDNVETTLAYLVPEYRRKDIKDFGKGVKLSLDGAELSARSSSEEHNFLALNLADEIIHGFRTPEDAKTFYDTTLQLAAAGKASPYMRELRFQSRSLRHMKVQ